MIRTILLSIACVLLIINIILTIHEAAQYYKATIHPGSIQGESGAHETAARAGRVKICGLWYNVYWIVVGREGLISLEERGEKSEEKDK